MAPIHSSTQCASSENWLPVRRWPFHVGAALFAASVAVTSALVVAIVEQAQDVPFTCPEGRSLEGSFRAGAHWCARSVDGRKRIDGRFVSWTGRRDADGEPGRRRETWYRAGRKHGPVIEYARPAPGVAQGPVEVVGAYAWGQPVGTWRYFDHTGALAQVLSYGAE